MNRILLRTAPLLALLALLALPGVALAADAAKNLNDFGGTLLDNLLTSLSTAFDKAKASAVPLAIGLGTIQLAWSAMKWALDERTTVAGLLDALVRQLLVFLFIALAISHNWPGEVTKSIQAMLVDESSEASMVNTPGKIFKAGAAYAARFPQSATIVATALLPQSGSAPRAGSTGDQEADATLLERIGSAAARAGDFVVGGVLSVAEAGLQYIVWLLFSLVVLAASTIVGAAVLWAYTMAAIELLVTQVEMLMVGTLGVFFLAGGMSDWTRDYAQRAWSYAASVGVKLAALSVLIVALDKFFEAMAREFINWAMALEFASSTRSGFDMTALSGSLNACSQALAMYVVAFVLTVGVKVLVERIPSILGAAFQGMPAMGGADIASGTVGSARAGTASMGRGAAAAGVNAGRGVAKVSNATGLTGLTGRGLGAAANLVGLGGGFRGGANPDNPAPPAPPKAK